MSRPSVIWTAVAALLLATSARAADPTPTGELRLRWDARNNGEHGPLAAAHALSPDMAAPSPDGAVAEAQLRHTLRTRLGDQPLALAGEVLASQQRLAGGAINGGLRVNELQASAERGAWAVSAGKKVVSWDVGFGFRPNDVVQQEARRTLLSSALEGRPLLQAEHFGADNATALVWVNPQQLNAADGDSRGARESALALRHYRHDGALDWHAFARVGAHTGASIGGALAWVGDAWEVHGSLRALQRHDGWTDGASAPGALPRANPWQISTQGPATQALIGAQWTGEWQQSLLVEAWHDGSAPGDAQWAAWGRRNQALLASPAPAAARAGNLAWQATPFDGPNLRRDSVFVRLAWQPDRWQLALDALLHPTDHGQILTASLQWQGERWRLNAALRLYGGPSDALLAQLPQRRSALLAATWAF
jgi:hypothetical protein